jgi:hypothetical protein
VKIVSALSRLSSFGAVALSHGQKPFGRCDRNAVLWNAHGIAARSPE